MRPNTAPLLGLCPIGKFVFSHTDAMRVKAAVQEKLRAWGVAFVDLEGAVPDGMVRDQAHVEPAVRHLRAKGVDCLFLPHCNFGTEGAAGMIARSLGMPTLLWGPRDEAPLSDGARLRDTLCGLLASSKVLHKLGVPFTYIENCRIDDAAFRSGLEGFLRASAAASTLRGWLRIGLIGGRIDFFWTTIVNESELLERFGVEIRPVDLAEFLRSTKDRAARGRAGYEKESADLRRQFVVESMSDDALVGVLALRDQMLAVAEDFGADALAVQDFMSIVNEIGAWGFLANSMVSDRLPVACESDVHGAISLAMLHRAALGAGSVFLTDLTVRHPTDDNAVLLWHAGAPLSMRHPQAKVRLGKHWILPSEFSGMPHFRLKDGPITVARFDGDAGRYQLAVGQGQSTDGPDTLNNYVWMRTNNWPQWERRLIEGPFIHHAAMTYEHLAGALVEACKYVPGLSPVRLDAP